MGDGGSIASSSKRPGINSDPGTKGDKMEPTRFTGMSAAALDGKLYVVNGISVTPNDTTTGWWGGMWYFDPTVTVGGASLYGVLPGTWYCVIQATAQNYGGVSNTGGWSLGMPLGNTGVGDPATQGGFLYGAALVAGEVEAGAVEAEGKLWMAGGVYSTLQIAAGSKNAIVSNFSNTLQCWTSSSGGWSAVCLPPPAAKGPILNTARGWPAMVAVANKLFVVGGFTGHTAYEPNSDGIIEERLAPEQPPLWGWTPSKINPRMPTNTVEVITLPSADKTCSSYPCPADYTVNSNASSISCPAAGCTTKLCCTQKGKCPGSCTYSSDSCGVGEWQWSNVTSNCTNNNSPSCVTPCPCTSTKNNRCTSGQQQNSTGTWDGNTSTDFTDKCCTPTPCPTLPPTLPNNQQPADAGSSPPPCSAGQQLTEGQYCSVGCADNYVGNFTDLDDLLWSCKKGQLTPSPLQCYKAAASTCGNSNITCPKPSILNPNAPLPESCCKKPSPCIPSCPDNACNIDDGCGKKCPCADSTKQCTNNTCTDPPAKACEGSWGACPTEEGWECWEAYQVDWSQSSPTGCDTTNNPSPTTRSCPAQKCPGYYKKCVNHKCQKLTCEEAGYLNVPVGWTQEQICDKVAGGGDNAGRGFCDWRGFDTPAGKSLVCGDYGPSTAGSFCSGYDAKSTLIANNPDKFATAAGFTPGSPEALKAGIADFGCTTWWVPNKLGPPCPALPCPSAGPCKCFLRRSENVMGGATMTKQQAEATLKDCANSTIGGGAGACGGGEGDLDKCPHFTSIINEHGGGGAGVCAWSSESGSNANADPHLTTWTQMN